MSTEDFYKEACPYLWNSDSPQKDEGFYGKEDMKRFAEMYHQAQLRSLGERFTKEQVTILVAEFGRMYNTERFLNGETLEDAIKEVNDGYINWDILNEN